MSLQEMGHAALQRGRTDLQDIAAKAAGGGLCKRIAPSVCAMADGEGGLIVLGIDESRITDRADRRGPSPDRLVGV